MVATTTLTCPKDERISELRIEVVERGEDQDSLEERNRSNSPSLPSTFDATSASRSRQHQRGRLQSLSSRSRRCEDRRRPFGRPENGEVSRQRKSEQRKVDASRRQREKDEPSC